MGNGGGIAGDGDEEAAGGHVVDGEALCGEPGGERGEVVGGDAVVAGLLCGEPGGERGEVVGGTP